MTRLGFHLSIAGSVANAPKEAADNGYTAFQIFTTSSRSWRNSVIKDDERNEFIGCSKINDVDPFAHIPYLCNPSSTKRDVYENSRNMLINNIRNCNLLGIKCLVIHIGSHLGGGAGTGIENACKMVNEALDLTENVEILLENGSGYKNSVGSRFNEIGEIIDRIGSSRIGMCFDTCHAFAAGYDIRNDNAVYKTANELSTYVKLSKLKLIHLNDARYELGSGLDRHWHIGKGHIGREGFLSLFRNKAFSKGPFIMELPDDYTASHADDINAAKSIIKQAGIS